MIAFIKNKLSDNILNFNGFNTERKIIVIESDDWGSIRMPSSKAFNNLLSAGVKVNKCSYNKYDTLASKQDLYSLFETLKKHKDSKGNHPVITANAIMANPNFNKIEESNFKEYSYELFTETLKKQFPNQNVFDIWKLGMDEHLFYPQLHGREHLNVNRWMKALRDNLPETKLAFDNKLFGISTTISSENRKSYMPAFDFDNEKELKVHEEILNDAFMIFKNTFNYESQSFIAPNYTWNSSIESLLKKHGVNTIQGARAQRQPTNSGGIIKKHYTGNINEHRQVYLARNVAFEPALSSERDWLKSVMNQISSAFFWKTPAIISTHRLNYIGGLDQENRNNSLRLLNEILGKIIKKWPNVEFMTSDKLGELILKTKNE